jgi:hypothetical protein
MVNDYRRLPDGDPRLRPVGPRPSALGDSTSIPLPHRAIGVDEVTRQLLAGRVLLRAALGDVITASATATTCRGSSVARYILISVAHVK